jgi:xanthine dehydrogenase YagR molybdenum-binding subunit
VSDTAFPDTPRVDALDKVRGKPIFGSDDHRPSLLHATLAVSTIAKGRITASIPGLLLPCTASS